MEKKRKPEAKGLDGKWMRAAIRREVPAGANRPREAVYKIGKPLKGRFYRSASYEWGWPLLLGIFEPPGPGGESYVQLIPDLHLVHPAYQVFEPTYLHPIVDTEGNVTLWRYKAESKKEYRASVEAALERMQSEWCSVRWSGKGYDVTPAEDLVMPPLWPEEAEDAGELLELCVPVDFQVAALDHQILAELRGAPDAGSRRGGGHE